MNTDISLDSALGVIDHHEHDDVILPTGPADGIGPDMVPAGDRPGVPFGEVIDRLAARGCDPQSRGTDAYAARCPVHQGSRHNLSVKLGYDGRTLLHCHHSGNNGRGSCTAETIAAALGLTMCDLLPADPATSRSSRRGKAGAGAAPKADGKPGKAKRKRKGFETLEDAYQFIGRRE